MSVSVASSITKIFSMGVVVLGLSLATGSAVSAKQEAKADASAQDAHPEFPQGPGRDTTLTKCSQCHSPSNILAMGRTREGWEGIITKMVDLGATGTDEEFSAILDYLTKSFPPASTNKVNVNKAPADLMATGLGITADEAKSIVVYREKNGPFKTLDDLKKVPALDAKKLDAKKDSITFQESGAS